MNDEERAQFLLRKEKAQNRLKELIAELQEKAGRLVRFGEELIDHPEKMTFSHFKSDVSKIPSELRRVLPVDRDELPDYEDLATLAYEIRTLKDELYWMNRTEKSN